MDQSARAARKTTIPIIATDIGVSKAKIAAAVPKVVATKAGDLAARWTISKLRIGILNVHGAAVTRLGGLSASTHRLTGGGSASLSVGKAFIISANGGKFVAFRIAALIVGVVAGVLSIADSVGVLLTLVGLIAQIDGASRHGGRLCFCQASAETAKKFGPNSLKHEKMSVGEQ